MSETPLANIKTITVTAENSKTGRTRFQDFGLLKGIINHPALALKIKSLGSSDARIHLNLDTGDIVAADAESIDAGATENYDGKFRCIAYEGINDDVQLKITMMW